MDDKEFLQVLIGEIRKEKAETVEQVFDIRRKLCRQHKPKIFPSIIQILLSLREDELENFSFLESKPGRTLSGVAPIAVMTKPISCVHGKCSMCPGGPKSTFGEVPQSYTGTEPAARRGARNFFDPYLQVFNRLEQYALLNQNFNKVELIIMGGTFPSFEKKYQEDFVKYCFKAMNDFGKLFLKEGKIDFLKFKQFFSLPHKTTDTEIIVQLQKKILGLKNECSLKTEQQLNENSEVRCVALCCETRPDYSGKKEINEMLKLGVTRAEVGVQSLNDEVLKKISRGHNVDDVVKCTQLLKDSFLKVGYHMMPGLPGSTKQEDIGMFKELFSNQDYKPDALKIYPCMVIEGTKLYDEWKNKKFNPLTTEEAAEIVIASKKFIPEYCRVMRVQRDIPTKVTSAGVGLTNLRQLIFEKMGKEGLNCRCIRCREPRNKNINFDQLKMQKKFYEASGGTEAFISLEDQKNDLLIGFCRLRIPYKPFRKEINQKSAGIRELHVYGKAAQLGQESTVQHKGFGKELLSEAEKIAKEEYDCKKILVISGIGAKEYYRQLNYKDDGVYMSKKI
ncbi:tRNA uridine(34) 5-carboxymethylaminomethyl modification radical SAM/GNAT enzyme Elp3 [Candidatus Woesearchaeota archaeon]|nr:tRNA uridine(34) 5-carboxymethylaminomethyl modification radical SAM/GNAT enzyme Elp3 [Candidatus Woesearchaeota archaeon]